MHFDVAQDPEYHIRKIVNGPAFQVQWLPRHRGATTLKGGTAKAKLKQFKQADYLPSKADLGIIWPGPIDFLSLDAKVF